MSGGFELSERRRTLLLRMLAEQGAEDIGYTSTVQDGGTVPLRAGDGPPPLSFAQQRMWFFQRLTPDSAAYNLPAVLRLRGALDADALERAMGRVLDRHEVLRTLLRDEGGRPVGALADTTATMARHDVGGADDPEQAALALVRSIVETPFDLAAGPLVRVALVRVGPAEHLLVLDMHHVAGDAWSWDVLLAQVAAELTSGGAPVPTARALQYADFAAWQRDRLERGEFDEQLAYWREQLHALPAPVEVVGDRPRPPRPRYRGGVLRAEIAGDAAAAVHELAAAERATPFMVCLAAWYTVLHRVTGERDLLVGSPVAERRNRALDDLVGIFVNTLALRARVDAAQSFRSLLADVRRMVIEASKRQDVPFERVVQEALPTRDAAPQLPLFHVMLAFRSAPERAVLGELRLAEVEVHNRTSKRDLTLQIIDTAGELRLHLEYDSDRYDELSARALLDAFRVLLGAAVAKPGTVVGTLPLLAAAAATAELDAGGRGGLPAAPGATVVDLVRAQAERTPEGAAVDDGSCVLSYAELVGRADATAAALRAVGAGPGHTVGVLVPRTADALVAVLAVLSCGAAYVPLDPLDPWPRVNSLVAAADVRVVLVPADAAPADGPAPADGLAPGVQLLTVATAATPAERCAAPHPDDAAYVLFTSGSTGAPKGVVVEHRQLVAYTRAVTERAGLAGPLQHALVQPLGVDSSLTMIFPPLCGGGTVHVVARERALDPQAMAELFARHGIDTLKIAPSHLRALHRAGDVDALLPRRCLIVGGEGSPQRWLESLTRPGLAVYNHYGPTEATVGVTMQSVTADGAAVDPETTTPLGRPLDGVRAHVLDDGMRLVPRGVAGELFLGGATVARGYAGMPGRTAEMFVPDPLGPPGARLYRTGDWARRRPDGTLEFLGRADDQVKIRGRRVEPGEVTAALRAQPGVADAIVMAQQTPGGARLVGLVVPAAADGSDIDGSDIDGYDLDGLRDRLRLALPEHLVPAVLTAVGSLPLSAHGKLDRSVLARLVPPEGQGSATATPGAATRTPATALERQVADIWCRVLGVDSVPADQNFFDAGGHSLLLVQLHHELQVATGREIALVELFNRTTVERQAELAASAPSEHGERQAAQLDRGRERGRQQSAQLRARQRAGRTPRDQHP